MAKTIKQIAEEREAKALTQLKGDMEITVKLAAPANGNRQNQFRGSAAGGRLAVRVYSGHGPASEVRGEIFVVKPVDADELEPVSSKFGGTCHKAVWRSVDDSSTIVTAWLPSDAEITTIKALVS